MISHLMFVDDLLLFGEANERKMKYVINSLDTFCKLSGQEVIREISSILFSKSAKRSLRVKLVHLSGYRETSNFGKYLGVPLSGKNLKRHDYNYITEQISAKLASWKARNLSMAGIIIITKSVIEEMPTYPMMTNILQKACTKEIQPCNIILFGEIQKLKRRCMLSIGIQLLVARTMVVWAFVISKT